MKKPREDRLGDAPIEERYRKMMRQIAEALDSTFNGEGDRTTGFVLLVFPFDEIKGDHPRCNYISNAVRSDVVTLLKEQLARFEGQPEIEGKA